MYLINFLTRLLVNAYRKEAVRIQNEAAKVGRAQAAEAEAAVDLARQADESAKQAVELGRQRHALEDRAIGVAARGKRIENFFNGGDAE